MTVILMFLVILHAASTSFVRLIRRAFGRLLPTFHEGYHANARNPGPHAVDSEMEKYAFF
jgi:hypothetical protein